MAFSFNLDSPDFAAAIKDGVESHLVKLIEQTLLDAVLPKIKNIAKLAAEQTFEKAQVHMERSMDPRLFEARINVNVVMQDHQYIRVTDRDHNTTPAANFAQEVKRILTEDVK